MTEFLSPKSTSPELPNQILQRRAYKKKKNNAELALDPINTITSPLRSNLNDLPRIPGYNHKAKGDLDEKITDLLDFGLNFEIKLPEHQKSKNKTKASIKMSDFVRKSVQKKILDFHHIDELVGNCSEISQELEKKKKNDKKFPIGNFDIKERESNPVKVSKTHLNLPPLAVLKCKSSDSLKIKEDSLKKLDIIVCSCKDLLENGKRRSRKVKTVPTVMNECKSR